ncbi:MAG TPA: lamin tail domain-containing protein, partial [Caulobacteraceae bacterium]
VRDAFRLRAGSPALGAGPNGLDMGAVVPAGASVSGEPDSPTPSRSALLRLGGPGITAYRYRTNQGPWSAEQPIGTPLVLLNLVDGQTYTVSVAGRNWAGAWQDTNSPAVSRPWSINTALVRVRLNEILARNSSAVPRNGGFPDLVELLNAGAITLNLSDWGVTDDPADKFKFRFPNNTFLDSGQYLLLQADDSAGGTNFHLGFGLDQAGDALLLFNGAGQLMDSVVFGRQLPDLSIGVVAGQWTLTRPTLGGPNTAHPLGDPRGMKINEWLADRRTLYDSDFLELWNPAGVPVDLGGLFLSDEPLGWPDRHRIAPLTFAGPGGHALFLPDGQAGAGPSHLNFRLSRERGAISLADPATNVIDCVFYGPQAPDVSQGRQPDGGSVIGPFPTATPGTTNPVVQPSFACVVSASTQVLMITNHNWRYNQSGQDLGTLWRAAGYNDASWPSGFALFGEEPNATYPEPIRTPLSLQRPGGGGQVVTYYFRTHFNAPSNLAGWNITVRAFVDDGAVFYVNGAEVGRLRMGSGTVTAASLANNAPEPANDTFTFPGAGIVAGDNVLAVEVHQTTATSSDVVFGMSMQAILSVTNCSLLGLVLNEVMANNQSVTNAVLTNASDWIELFNPTATNIVLSGLSLTDDAMDRTRWIVPPGLVLPPGGYRLVLFDPTLPASTNAAGVLNTGFGLGAGGDQVYLFDAPARGGALLDSIAFGVQPVDFSIGRLPPLADRWGLTIATPGSANL